jgi:hypothetical protein
VVGGWMNGEGGGGGPCGGLQWRQWQATKPQWTGASVGAAATSKASAEPRPAVDGLRARAPSRLRRRLTPRKGKVSVCSLQLTAAGPAVTIVMPTIAPTMECVVDTGISQYVARICSEKQLAKGEDGRETGGGVGGRARGEGAGAAQWPPIVVEARRNRPSCSGHHAPATCRRPAGCTGSRRRRRLASGQRLPPPQSGCELSR